MVVEKIHINAFIVTSNEHVFLTGANDFLIKACDMRTNQLLATLGGSEHDGKGVKVTVLADRGFGYT